MTHLYETAPIVACRPGTVVYRWIGRRTMEVTAAIDIDSGSSTVKGESTSRVVLPQISNVERHEYA